MPFNNNNTGRSQAFVGCAVILLLVGILLTIILVPLSLSHVEYYQYGLKKRKTGSVDTSKVYGAGRHMIGPANTFIHYQADSHFIEIEELSVFSAGDNEDSIGLSFKVDVDFTFLLIKEEVGLLHEDLAGSYETVIVSRARDAIKNEAIFVTFEEYFQQRKAVEERFRQAVENRWNEPPSLHCALDQFHLGRIQIPDSVAERQLETRLQNERNDREAFLQQAQLERDLTAVEVNRKRLETDAVLRTAEAEASLIRARAAAEADQIRIDARINATQDLLQALDITTQQDMATFDYIQSLRERHSLDLHVSYLSDNSVVRVSQNTIGP
jgi:regulator of protease activity HflC (stomatin/prohibitin superfamily)